MKIINDWDIKEIENKIQVRRTGYYNEHMKFEVYLEDDELRSFSKYAKNLTEADILVKRIILFKCTNLVCFINCCFIWNCSNLMVEI